MLVAGEPSGDLLAAELVAALRERLPDAAFIGAGGPRMSAAGVELVHDMSGLAVVGITDVLLKLLQLRRLMRELLAVALQRQPDVIVGVDYGGFNLRFGHAVKEYVRNNPFSKWKPRIVQFVSPQVWASRPGRAQRLAADYDLLLSIFPFEKDWYARRVPQLRVEFVGHPMVGRFAPELLRAAEQDDWPDASQAGRRPPRILLLPGSRKSELKRHLPPMLEALRIIQDQYPAAEFRMIAPSEGLLKIVAGAFVKRLGAGARLPAAALTPALIQGLAQQSFPGLVMQLGGLPGALAQADLALSKTGTVTMECAFFGVPAVTFYQGSWLNYQIARRLITVKSLTMPNLLAGEEVYPEFIQHQLTAENLARAALDLLQTGARRRQIKARLARIVASLGGPGAPRRAAAAILSLLE